MIWLESTFTVGSDDKLLKMYDHKIVLNPLQWLETYQRTSMVNFGSEISYACMQTICNMQYVHDHFVETKMSELRPKIDRINF